MNRRTTTDPKIDRIQQSLGLAAEDAHWLASVADEVTADAGTLVGHARFTHVVTDAAGESFIVEAGAPPVRLTSNAPVLVVPRHAAARLTARLAGTARAVPAPRVARVAV